MKTLLPSMHMQGFGETLRKYASEVPPGQSIVEVGSWLGASAYHLAAASDPTPLHLYDKWMANASEVKKAIERGEPRLEISESFLDVVKENLAEFGERIHYNQGDIRQAEYASARPIGLYVDDASKNQLDMVLPNFAPRFVPGTIVLLMDYFWGPCENQRRYVDTLDWEFIAEDEFDTNTSIWRVRG